MTPRNTVICGEALEVLRTLSSQSVECVVTSPPYFQARHYQAGAGELGQEPHVDAWAENLRAVAAEVARVLVPTGSVWLNVGDVYSSHARFGAARKSLLLGPERLARGLLKDGWIVRNRVAWVKSSHLPSPVTDRLTNGWEYLWHLTRQADYFYDLDAIRLPLVTKRPSRSVAKLPAGVLGALVGRRDGLDQLAREGRAGHPLGKNPSDVWIMPPGRRVGAHFATFPEALVRRPILGYRPHARLYCLRSSVAKVQAPRYLLGGCAAAAAAGALRLRGTDPSRAGARSVRRVRHNAESRPRARPRRAGYRAQSGVCRARTRASRFEGPTGCGVNGGGLTGRRKGTHFPSAGPSSLPLPKGGQMTKAQEVHEKVEALVAGGVSKAEAFKKLAAEYGQPVNSIRGAFYQAATAKSGGTSRPRRRETTPEDALADARAALERSIHAIDREVEAAEERAKEAAAEAKSLMETAAERKQAITERLEALK